MDERQLRLWAGAEAHALGYGGVAAVARATGMAISTVQAGRNEVRAGATPSDVVHVRRPGAGRPRLEDEHPELPNVIESLVEPVTRGDPESPLRWTCKSLRNLSSEMKELGYVVSPQKIGEILHALGYSLQGAQKTIEGDQHPDRNAQFEQINALTKARIARGVPTASVDTKKKELVGNFKNAGEEWHRSEEQPKVTVHDFPGDAVGKAIPYGVYNIGDNSAWVSVGTDHDTPAFSAASIETWWEKMGRKAYPEATEIYIIADAGGSNGYRSRVWKAKLQEIADRHDLIIHVSHFPPGTSKWNKIEHRLFSFITMNWRGVPLTTYETIVSLISSTTTTTGLHVEAGLDTRKFPTGERVTDREMRELNIVRDAFHGDWNYSIHPRSPD